MAICKGCGRSFSDQESYAGFKYCEHCGGTFCLIHKAQESKAVSWVLHSSVEDARSWVEDLTDAEIDYCLAKEKRVTVRKMLERELNRRVATKVMEAKVLP